MMTMTDKPNQEKGAFIRDGALVLYFDMAEKPVLARFDLDTLAQASFEVSTKDKDGFYTIMLHDFSGEAQPVAQFASKGDAHQALYAILQALLAQKEENVSSCKSGKCCVSRGCFGFVRSFFKTILHLIVLAMLVYGVAYVYYGYVVPKDIQQRIASQSDQATSDEANVTSSEGEQQSVLPKGEAMSADDFLSGLAGGAVSPSSGASKDAAQETP